MATDRNEALHGAVDQLALEVEKRIQENAKTLEEAADFPIGHEARVTNTIPSIDVLLDDE